MAAQIKDDPIVACEVDGAAKLSSRLDEVRVFYDVSGTTVEVLAIVPKLEAESWLAQFGSPE